MRLDRVRFDGHAATVNPSAAQSVKLDVHEFPSQMIEGLLWKVYPNDFAPWMVEGCASKLNAMSVLQALACSWQTVSVSS